MRSLSELAALGYEQIELARAKGNLARAGDGGAFSIKHVSNLAVVDADGNVQIITNTACHAGLRSFAQQYIGGRRKPQAVDKPAVLVSGVQKQHRFNGNYTEESVICMLDYLVQRSPFSRTFITNSGEEAVKLGYTAHDANFCANVIAIGSMTARMVSERPEIAVAFTQLVRAGCNEDIAIMAAHLIQFGEASYTKPASRNPHESHVGLYLSAITDEGFIRYCNHDECLYKSKVGKLAEGKAYSSISDWLYLDAGINRMFDRKLKLIINIAAEDSVSKARGVVASNNPFLVVKNEDVFTVDEKVFWPLAAERLNQLKEEIVP